MREVWIVVAAAAADVWVLGPHIGIFECVCGWTATEFKRAIYHLRRGRLHPVEVVTPSGHRDPTNRR